MLSIGAMGSGQAGYYVGLAREDYYHKGGEPPGQWLGAGAAKLGLMGIVEREVLLDLFRGVGTNGENLVQNAGSTKRQPGWDLTFSASKSVSLVWALSDEPTRSLIAAAQFAAVNQAVAYLEAETITRRGRGGAIKQPAQLVIGAFEHGVSRSLDPQLHTHCLVLNLAVRADGTTGTIESRSFYRSKMAAGALYRAELSYHLSQLGFSIVREGTTFEIAGVPRALLQQTSKRRAEIVDALAEAGDFSARAAARAALQTRSVKGAVTRESLFTLWAEMGNAHHFGQNEVQHLRGPEHRLISGLSTSVQPADVVQAALETLAREQSHFSERDLLRTVAEEAPGRGLSGSAVRAIVTESLRQCIKTGEIVFLGQRKDENRYTTRQLLAVEKELLADAGSLRTETRFCLSDTILSASLTAMKAHSTPQMSEEQLNALRHITQEPGQIALVNGRAGTGKTTLLQAARHGWEQAGYKVIGTAVAGKAARGLYEGAGIKSVTLYQLLHRYSQELNTQMPFTRRAIAEFKYATWQIGTKTRSKMLGTYHKPTSRLAHEWKYATHQITRKHRDFLNYQLEHSQYQPDRNTVVVVDEAGMVGTQAMAQLVALIKKAGAKLILLGDEGQIQPVEVGGPFRALGQLLGAARLAAILRQNLDKSDETPTWRREVVTDFSEGNAHRALRALHERGFVRFAPDRAAAMELLIRTWGERGKAQPQEYLIFGTTRTEVTALNRLAQAARQQAGLLGTRALRLGEDIVREKDRVLVTANASQYGVYNGDLGTVERFDLLTGKILVRLDREQKQVALPYRQFRNVQLGYAITTHKGQGATVQNAYVLCGGKMADKEVTYVQASRARQDTYFFSETHSVWNPKTWQMEDRTLEELAKQMSQSHSKDLAHSVLWENRLSAEQAPRLER